MATQLKNTLSFDLAAGASVVVNHGLNTNGLAVVPDVVFVPSQDIGVVATTTQLTITNNGAVPIAGSILVEHWHTYERAFGAAQTLVLPVQPFVVYGGAPGSGVYSNFVFRPGGVQGGNVYTDWAALMAAANLVQGWKTIQIDNSLGACVIPAGVWDMTQIELVGFVTGATGAGPSVTVADGTSFTNLRKVGGELTIINANTVNAPVVIAAAPGAAAVFEFGAGIFGDFPQLNNTGGAPFWDMSALAAGQQFLLRIAGVVTGTAPAIQMGASQGAFSLSLFDAARVHAGMIVGTDPAASLFVFNFGTGGQLNRQSGFAGTITYGAPSSFTGLPAWPRFWMFPASVAQAPIAPSTAAFTTGTGLGMNACLRFDTTAGDINQTLPIVRAAAPAIGAFSTTNGAIESTGLVVIVKNEAGANNVNVSPSAGETINGGAGAVIVATGVGKMFISDGVSNWISVP